MVGGTGNPLCPCPKTGAWSSAHRAGKRLEEIQQNYITGELDRTVKVPVRVYMCRYGVYHLTSMPRANKEESYGEGNSGPGRD